jgi:hypothetical protein
VGQLKTGDDEIHCGINSTHIWQLRFPSHK